MGTSSPPASPPSASNSESSATTRPTSPTPPKLFDVEPTNKNGLPNAVEEKPHMSHFQILDSVEYIDKQTRYEADYTQRLMAKYLSKNLYGGDIFDEKTIDGETIMSSRWCCTESFADPRKVFEEQSSNDSISASETKHSSGKIASSL